MIVSGVAMMLGEHVLSHLQLHESPYLAVSHLIEVPDTWHPRAFSALSVSEEAVALRERRFRHHWAPDQNPEFSRFAARRRLEPVANDCALAQLTLRCGTSPAEQRWIKDCAVALLTLRRPMQDMLMMWRPPAKQLAPMQDA